MTGEAAPPAPRRRFALLVGAALPIAFFFYVMFWLIPVPQAAHQASLNLAGEWKVLPGSSPEGALPETDDSKARPMTVPGGFRAQGFTDSDAWLRKRFVAPPGLLGQPLFLLVSDTRSGRGRVFLNGQFVGKTEVTPRGLKAETSGIEGWAVPANLLQPGENLLAIHYHWGWAGMDGIHDGNVLLGPASLLEPYYVDQSDTRRALESGAGFLMAFLLVLLGGLVAARWAAPNRPLYLSSMAMLAASMLYLGDRAGVFFRIPVDGWGIPFGFLTVIFILYTQPDFIDRYFLGPRSRYRVWNGYVCAAFLVTMGACMVMRQEAATTLLWDALRIYSLLPITYFTSLACWRALRRRPLGLELILASGILCSALTGAADLWRDSWTTYPLGISACAIWTAVVLIADFTKVSFDNFALSQSLKVTNAELADALVKAQEAVRLKTEFVASVSHELRTPLNSVLNIPGGLIEQFAPETRVKCAKCRELFALEEGERLEATTACPACSALGTLTSDEGFRFIGDGKVTVNGLKQIHRSGTHLLSLIEDVLDFSKLEAGRMHLTLEWVEVQDALRKVVETLEPLAKKRLISLTTLLPQGGGTLRVDGVKLAQIFINLVGNAVKFSPDGGTVKISAEERDGKWLFSVTDQGIGIAKEHHQLIFESFRQVDGGNTRRFGGTGLGLAITRRLVEAHGGTLGLDSEVGKGSTFWFLLPKEGPNESVVPSAFEPLSPAAGGKKILILDDERFAVENLKLALQPLRHDVKGIQDPRLLEAKLNEYQPDLLILDVMMPELSGLDILRMMKARGSRLPVLVSSAYHTNADVVRELGASWLPKPWRSDALQSEVTRLLLEQQLAQQRSPAA